MLLVLTGDVQIGKTRWLVKLVDELSERGIESCGVVAPGKWIPSSGPYSDAHGYEKLGIDNVLLPQKERIAFALRPDVAVAKGYETDGCQSGRAGLGWCIFDDAIDQVNRHFDLLNEEDASDNFGLLIVDELGRLELLRNEGLTSALTLLEKGPMNAGRHALVVVRDALSSHAIGRFSERWVGHAIISPDDNGRLAVLGLFGIQA